MPSDFEAWLPLWGQYLAQNDTKMRWPDRTALFRQLAHQTDNAAAMIVECDGKIVGIAHYQIHHARFAFENAYYVQDIYVIPAFQAQRAGATLMRAIYAAAQQTGAPAVYWKAAEHLYGTNDTAAATSSFLQFRKAA
ncbi:GNAT family N-acetyltransferase [Pseudorhodobacter ferrugineus]|uniref:GNAT family N-acetyltransferase n=1 Tax=Pseudorhodobacter ferrugineus TaxID=77008 RepID=UPI0003B61461|nr:GNAT family N-acetyltransferase [Pseudorhodobacter ferrugineus]